MSLVCFNNFRVWWMYVGLLRGMTQVFLWWLPTVYTMVHVPCSWDMVRSVRYFGGSSSSRKVVASLASNQ